MNIRVVGIDVGKTVFHVVGMDGHGKVILKNRLSRPQLLKRLVNLPPCLIGMEASCGAHYLARSLSKFGHDVRLIPAQFVRPFVKSQKNDYVDAEAIAEAVQRPTMRFVPVKTEDQLDLQALHRVRDRLMERRTSVINQIRAFLLERGLALRAGSNHLRTNLPAVLAAAEQNMSPRIYQLLCLVAEEWHSIEQQIERLDRGDRDNRHQRRGVSAIAHGARNRAVDRHGHGGSVGNGSAFGRGREFAAWLGLVPRQHSTGGKARLLGISKHGNEYLRRLFIHGGRSVQHRVSREKHRFGPWLAQLELRANSNIVGVAMANKLARIAWVVLNRQEVYRPYENQGRASSLCA